MKLSSKKPELFFIAHRMNTGNPADSSYNQVDNSMEALNSVLETTKAANKYGHFKGFECDVRLTSDNQLVVLHDGNAKGMTKNKLDKNISDMTYAELHSIELSNTGWYYNGLKKRALLLPDSKRIRKIIDQKLQKATAVPKAFEMFDYLASKGYKNEIVLELKEASDKNRDAMIELINTYKSRLNIVAKGYDAKRILKIGEITGIKIGQLEAIKLINQEKDIDAEYIKTMPFDFYSIIWTKVTNKKLSAFVEYGKDLYTWTIDSAVHLFAVLNSLERFYDKVGSLPQNTNLITNIPILLEEYIKSGNHNILLSNSISKKYNKLFTAPTAAL
ncbi:MAG: glycerophosphodiester phosphodiesterase family protein [Eubacteriales bacterium]